MMDKAVLRREMRARRQDAGEPELDFASQEIKENLQTWLGQSNCCLQRVAIFLAQPREPNLDEFARVLQSRGISVFAPQLNRSDKPFMEIAPDWSNIEVNARGWREPLEYSDGRFYSACKMNLIFLPGLAFAESGARLGQGGGWYDRVLENLPSEVLRAGVCFDSQVVDFIPREAHDQDVSIIFTDKRIIHV